MITQHPFSPLPPLPLTPELFYCRMRYSYNNEFAADMFFWIMCSGLPGTILIFYKVVPPRVLEGMIVNKENQEEVTVKMDKEKTAEAYLREVGKTKRRGRRESKVKRGSSVSSNFPSPRNLMGRSRQQPRQKQVSLSPEIPDENWSNSSDSEVSGAGPLKWRCPPPWPFPTSPTPTTSCLPPLHSATLHPPSPLRHFNRHSKSGGGDVGYTSYESQGEREEPKRGWDAV